MTIWLGAIVVLVTIYFLVKQYETRMVLFGAGVVLAVIAGDLMAPFKSFSGAMKQTALFENIIAAMGFAMVMKITQCDKHLIASLGKWAKRAGGLMIPATVMLTFFINISVTSAAGCSAAAGAIFIPLLMASGVKPATAGAAVFAGTIGAMLNPGHALILVAAEVSKSTPLEVVANNAVPLVVAGLIGAFSLYFVAKYLKEDKGYELPAEFTGGVNLDEIKVNYLWAIVPMIPLVILMLGTKIPMLKPLSISHAMIIGVLVGMLVTRTTPAKISKEFWHGAGDGFGHVFGIIVCALIFVGGMQAVGLIKAITAAMVKNVALAKISAAVGPFVLALLSGSGDAASVAFNQSVTINAAQMGLNGRDMASMSVIAANLGRTMSPAAGACVICAGLANTSPIALMKRNAPGMVIACIVALVLLMYK